MRQLAERTQGLNFPLSKEEWNRIDGLKKTLNVVKNQTSIRISIIDYKCNTDCIYSLQQHCNIKIHTEPGLPYYELESSTLYENLFAFWKWVDEQDIKAKRSKRREWKITVISGVVAAIISSITSIVISFMS